MKRKSTTYHYVRYLFLVLIIILLPVSVWAQETTLTTTIPTVHTLHITLNGKGQIVVDDVPYEQIASLQVKRYNTPKISVIPSNGWQLQSVFLDGQDITTEVQNGTFLLAEMCNDVTLTVIFETQISTPQTGDQSNIEIIYLLILLSVIGITLCVITHCKTRTNNT